MKHELALIGDRDEMPFVAQIRDVRDRLDRLIKAAAAAESPFPNEENQRATEWRVRRFQKVTKKRNELFETRLFSDPAWDMLLELYIAHLSDSRDYVTSVCIASGVPQTTALRYVTALEEEELVFRSPDPLDGRRYHLRLAPRAVNAMQRFFS